MDTLILGVTAYASQDRTLLAAKAHDKGIATARYAPVSRR
jgi:hypothetical protein